MRILASCFSLTLLCSCSSRWEAKAPYVSVLECTQGLPWYVDADGDGWGDPSILPISSCEAVEGTDSQVGYTARNGLDCDDADPNLGMGYGELCPSDILPSDGGEVRGFINENNEFIVLRSPVDRYSFSGAFAICEAGWGGTLATFDSVLELSDVSDVVAGKSSDSLDDWGVGGFFAYIQFQSSGGQWTVGEGSGLAVSDYLWCEEQLDPVVMGAGFGVGLLFQESTYSKCLGTAALLGAGSSYVDAAWSTEVNLDGQSEYGFNIERVGHMICRRPLIRPGDRATPADQVTEYGTL